MTDSHPFTTLDGHNFINLTTTRKSGVPVSTPVWFARQDDTLYVHTGADSGKVKRIRHTPGVTVAPSKVSGEPLGPEIAAVARILPAGSDDDARRALRRKYNVQHLLFIGLGQLTRRGRDKAVRLTITLAD